MPNPSSPTTSPGKPAKLGPNIFLYTPTNCSKTIRSSPSTPAPQLIIICSWMGAQTKHIDKYISGYQKLFPTSRILLLRNELLDIFLPTSMHLRRLQPALDVVLSTEKAATLTAGASNSSISTINSSVPASPQSLTTPKPTRQPILLTAFSNGGSNIATHLALLYSRHHTQPLPIHTLLLDSTPGTYTTPSSGVRAILSTLPSSSRPTISSRLLRLTAWLLSWPLLTTLFMFQWVFGTENVITVMRRRLNDPGLFPLSPTAFSSEERDDKSRPGTTKNRGGGGRVYIFSATDPLVSHLDVEAHAAEAEARGSRGVRKERFEGTGHVAHIIGEKGGDGGERYWRIVREGWGS